MKIKNVLSILLLIFFCTGCKATYNLDISDDGFKENITVTATSIDENNDFVKNEYPAFTYEKGNNLDPTQKEDGVKYYKSSLSRNNEFKFITYEYSFKEDEFASSTAVNSAFDTLILRKYDHDDDEKEDYTMLVTDNTFNYFENNENLESVDIIITCHYKIISSNADSENGNILTWHLTKDNLKEINLIYDTRSSRKNSKIIDSNTIQYFIMIGIVGVVLFIGYIIFGKFSKNKNKIPK